MEIDTMISLKDIFEILKKKGMRQKKKLLTPKRFTETE